MPIKVKAKDLGYFGFLREPGSVFEIEKEAQFSSKWMEKVVSKKGKAKQDEDEEDEFKEQSRDSDSESVI